MDEILVESLCGKLSVRLGEIFTVSLGCMLSERLGEKLDEILLRVQVRGYLQG